MYIPRFGAYLPTFILAIYLAIETTQMKTNYPGFGHEPSLLKAHFQPGIDRKICIFFGCLYGCNPCPLACYIPTLPGWQGQRVFVQLLKMRSLHVFFSDLRTPRSRFFFPESSFDSCLHAEQIFKVWKLLRSIFL